MFGGSVAKSQADMDAIHERVVRRFSGVGSVKIHRDTSARALAGFPDAFFDWVYIDGNHEYDYVREDVEICLAKVKRDGYVCGDDVNWVSEGRCPVRLAVEDVVRDRLDELDVTWVGKSQFVLAYR